MGFHFFSEEPAHEQKAVLVSILLGALRATQYTEKDVVLEQYTFPLNVECAIVCGKNCAGNRLYGIQYKTGQLLAFKEHTDGHEVAYVDPWNSPEADHLTKELKLTLKQALQAQGIPKAVSTKLLPLAKAGLAPITVVPRRYIWGMIQDLLPLVDTNRRLTLQYQLQATELGIQAVWSEALRNHHANDDWKRALYNFKTTSQHIRRSLDAMCGYEKADEVLKILSKLTAKKQLHSTRDTHYFTGCKEDANDIKRGLYETERWLNRCKRCLRDGGFKFDGEFMTKSKQANTRIQGALRSLKDLGLHSLDEVGWEHVKLLSIQLQAVQRLAQPLSDTTTETLDNSVMASPFFSGSGGFRFSQFYKNPLVLLHMITMRDACSGLSQGHHTECAPLSSPLSAVLLADSETAVAYKIQPTDRVSQEIGQSPAMFFSHVKNQECYTIASTRNGQAFLTCTVQADAGRDLDRLFTLGLGPEQASNYIYRFYSILADASQVEIVDRASFLKTCRRKTNSWCCI
eukprot:Protomagalhaensia_wolfi_Nauph_80__437@NODE_1242_length_1638_cov_6_345216_g955_i0_p1_GENE_NODE_1242_length_1638_cov_6_345216_g955_i0NODE_1242_length_1638_cov_6_345216_g955_i0_p1_ORF_typecomplete_len529_score72_64TrbM/PF07424_11/6_7e03TrbM/PF07424_11/0_46SPATA1_C/PF15743_5/0_24_NODE_1242_length_1638_cov_6_345216_g955_i0511595